MCLAVPGKVMSVSDGDPLMRTGWVSFGGILKEINLSFVPEARVNDFVIVHVGFAISKMNEQEAQKVFDALDQMDIDGVSGGGPS